MGSVPLFERVSCEAYVLLVSGRGGYGAFVDEV